jgi:hypothetical protein
MAETLASCKCHADQPPKVREQLQVSASGVLMVPPFNVLRLARASPGRAYRVGTSLLFCSVVSHRHNRTSSRTHDQTTMYLPLSSISRSEARIFCCSMDGAFGSKRPSFWFFFQARTLSVRVSYSATGISYFGTEAKSEKSVRAPGGRVSPT